MDLFKTWRSAATLGHIIKLMVLDFSIVVKRPGSSFFGIFMALIFSSSVFAENDCGDVKHSQSSCMPAIRNQSDSNWCYANVAADLLSFSVCRPISGSGVALSYLEHSKQSTGLYNGGWVEPALEAAKKFGACKEEDLPSSILEDGKYKNIIMLYASTRYLSDVLSNGNTCAQNNEPTNFRRILPNTNLLDLLEVMNVESSRRIFALAKKSCKEKIFSEFQIDKCPDWSHRDLRLKYINENLSSGPIALTTMGNYVKSPDTIHAVSIVGRRKNEIGLCEYQIRNSFGPGWENNGYAWISKEKLGLLLQEPITSCLRLK